MLWEVSKSTNLKMLVIFMQIRIVQLWLKKLDFSLAPKIVLTSFIYRFWSLLLSTTHFSTVIFHLGILKNDFLVPVYKESFHTLLTIHTIWSYMEWIKLKICVKNYQRPRTFLRMCWFAFFYYKATISISPWCNSMWFLCCLWQSIISIKITVDSV